MTNLLGSLLVYNAIQAFLLENPSMASFLAIHEAFILLVAGVANLQWTAYIYENLLRKYMNVGGHMSSNHPEGQRRILQMMSLDTRKSVESYIEKYDPEAFERVVKAAEKVLGKITRYRDRNSKLMPEHSKEV